MQQIHSTGKDTICDECNLNFPSLYCKDCDQSICQNCDKIIHNKGKRKLHERISTVQEQIFVIFHENILDYFEDIYSRLEKQFTDSTWKKKLILYQNKNNAQINRLKSLFEEQYIYSISQSEIDIWDILNQNKISEIIIFGQKLFNEQIMKGLFEKKKNETTKILFYDPLNQQFTESPNNKKELDNNKSQQSSIYAMLDSTISHESSQTQSQQSSIQTNSTQFSKSHILNQSQDQARCIIPFQLMNTSIVNKNQSTTRQNNIYYLNQYQKYKTDILNCSQQLTYNIQKELFILAEKGQILINNKQLKEIISKYAKSNNVDGILDQALKLKLLSQKERQFEDPLLENDLQQNLSLQLENISLQSLVWILKSIKNDQMTPSEKLILSRIKECFGFKPNQKAWEKMVRILKKQQYINNYDQLPEAQQQHICDFNIDLPKIQVSLIRDPLSGQDVNVILLKKDVWIFEDQGSVDEESDPLWLDVQSFLQNYFKKSIEESIDNKNKAIPGGRYGCAQYIKMYGSESLRNCSIGKLNLYVQNAINKGIIRYQRTLLIGNTLDIEKASTLQDDSINEQTQIKIKKIQDAIIEILQENLQGVSFAQIPQFLKKKVDFVIDYQELGFAKLKNLLNTMSDRVEVGLSKSNNNFIYLNETEKARYTDKQSQDLEERLLKFENTTFRILDQTYQKQYQNQDEYLERVRKIIVQILQQQSSLMLDDLYEQLCNQLQMTFNPLNFKCKDFNSFLSTQMRAQVDVQPFNNSYLVKLKEKQNSMFMFKNNSLDDYNKMISDKKKFNIHSTPFRVPEVENESTPRSQQQKSFIHNRNNNKFNGDDFYTFVDQSISTLKCLDNGLDNQQEDSSYYDFNENIRCIEQLLDNDDIPSQLFTNDSAQTLKQLPKFFTNKDNIFPKGNISQSKSISNEFFELDRLTQLQMKNKKNSMCYNLHQKQ